jgi:serine-type D-Ala-D-Ala carboxypeptidase (penicillin-binding protein 5/6)
MTTGPVFHRSSGRGLRRQRGLHRSRGGGRFRRIFISFLVALALIVVLGVAFVVVQLRRSVPGPVLHTTAPATTSAGGPVPALPWPSGDEAAVAVAGVGSVGSAGPTSPVPIASLAKVMTAVVVTRDHPLAPGQPGPAVTLTAADQAIYAADNAAGDSVAPVVAGESLTELQLLQALLIPSADNLAPAVATWDAGNLAAFVAKMNATAAALGMHSTTYTDPAGVSPTTVSTAADQLRLAEAVAANPVLMSIVRETQLTIPNSPVLSNYNALLGQDGIVGIKTGATSAAGGCFMFAADASAAGHPIQVLGVVLGNRTNPLIAGALQAGETLIAPVAAAVHPVTVLPAGSVEAHITYPWGPTVAVTTATPVTVLHIGPTPVAVAFKARQGNLPDQLPAGSRVGTVTVTAGGETQTVPAVTTQSIQAPTRTWRLERR